MAQPQIDDNKANGIRVPAFYDQVVELMLQGRKVQELVSIIRQAQASIIFPTVSALRRTGRKNQLISQLVKLYVDMQASGNETNLRAFKSLLEKECSMTIARAHHIYYHYCVENSIQPPPQALQRAMTTHSADPALAARSSPAFTTAPQVFSNFPSNSGGSQPSPYQGLRFQPTPFYSVLQTLSNVITLNENWGRQSVASLRFKLDPAKTTATSYGQANTSAPICPCLLVTSSENALLSYQPNHPGVSAEYPRLYSIKVDGRFIGQNIIVRHSLKSKQTNPIDLSSFLHPNVFDHWLDVSYTASKKMVAVVVGIQTFTVDELLDRLCRDRFVAKDQIVEQLQGKDGDDEISTTTNVISLTCPLSYIRIEHPCRSNRCNHLQCFDAKSYLQMNELTPTWMCPICSQPADFDGLMIDGYSQDIVKQIPITETQVYVDSDFKWQLPSTAEAVAIGAGEADDDCDVEIKSLDLTSDDGPSVATPAKRKAHALSPSQGTPQRGSKTARVQIIDLTLSDSDELTAPSEHVPPPLPPQSTRAMATTVDTARPSLPVIDQAAYADAFGLPGPPAFAMPHPTLPPIAANPRPTSPLTPLPYGSVSDTPWWRPMNSPRPSSLSSPTVSFSSSPIIPQSPTSAQYPTWTEPRPPTRSDVTLPPLQIHATSNPPSSLGVRVDSRSTACPTGNGHLTCLSSPSSHRQASSQPVLTTTSSERTLPPSFSNAPSYNTRSKANYRVHDRSPLGRTTAVPPASSSQPVVSGSLPDPSAIPLANSCGSEVRPLPASGHLATPTAHHPRSTPSHYTLPSPSSHNSVSPGVTTVALAPSTTLPRWSPRSVPSTTPTAWPSLSPSSPQEGNGAPTYEHSRINPFGASRPTARRGRPNFLRPHARRGRRFKSTVTKAPIRRV